MLISGDLCRKRLGGIALLGHSRHPKCLVSKIQLSVEFCILRGTFHHNQGDRVISRSINHHQEPTQGAGPPETAREPFCCEDIVLRPLKTPSDIASILHLRDEIDLSVHTTFGAQFAALEKKETGWVLLLPSI